MTTVHLTDVFQGDGTFAAFDYDDTDPAWRNWPSAADRAVAVSMVKARHDADSAAYAALRVAVLADPDNPDYRNLDLHWLGLL
jgi:hypothetical protein